jgi:Na+/H+-dicarboxylate symporter
MSVHDLYMFMLFCVITDFAMSQSYLQGVRHIKRNYNLKVTSESEEARLPDTSELNKKFTFLVQLSLTGSCIKIVL